MLFSLKKERNARCREQRSGYEWGEEELGETGQGLEVQTTTDKIHRLRMCRTTQGTQSVL